MRHKKNKSKLSRTSDQRLALVRNQVSKLLEHGYINTTMPRAKATKAIAEKLITRAKRGTLADIRICASQLHGKKTLSRLVKDVAPNIGNSDGGYTRIAKLKYRRGDGTLVVRLSLNNYEPGSPASG